MIVIEVIFCHWIVQAGRLACYVCLSKPWLSHHPWIFEYHPFPVLHSSGMFLVGLTIPQLFVFFVRSSGKLEGEDIVYMWYYSYQYPFCCWDLLLWQGWFHVLWYMLSLSFTKYTLMPYMYPYNMKISLPMCVFRNTLFEKSLSIESTDFIHYECIFWDFIYILEVPWSVIILISVNFIFPVWNIRNKRIYKYLSCFVVVHGRRCKIVLFHMHCQIGMITLGKRTTSESFSSGSREVPLLNTPSFCFMCIFTLVWL
jgi:hypothetical protein